MADGGLERIEELCGAMLRSVSGGERRRIMRTVARQIATSQRERIARQRAPDGSAFAPRKPKDPPAPGAYPLRFLYPKGAAEPRLVTMASWVRQGPLLTGFDQEAGEIRSFFWDKVAKWLPTSDVAGGKGRLRRRGSIRQKAMFRKLRNGRNLRSGATDGEAWVGFSGRAAEIAWVHQEGRPDRPAPRARAVRYPKRELLGLTEAERGTMVDLVLAHIADQ
ncbi:phage virion morphogenesis protein [Sphingomonas sp.]|jgi:phage gpG-like protein|uniref:phage virion morphogenesis protein n=1 Tax=Sphingomonas sp. TaxID=28214 RepID=UPI002ED8196A